MRKFLVIVSATLCLAANSAVYATGVDNTAPFPSWGLANTSSPHRVLAPASRTGRDASHKVFLYWPTGHPVAVPRRFDPPPQKWLAGHRGIDLRASPGSSVYAATDATVLFAGKLVNRSLVSLEDSTGRRYTYEPVEPCVKEGDAVARGDVIGTVLPGHSSREDVLHFGVKDGATDYLDPLVLLGGRIRLWPLA